MSLLAVGVSHQTAPVALLEQFALAPDDRVKALHELVATDHVSEALVLATCNRIEVFAEVERFHGGVADVTRVLARQAGASVEELSPYVTVHYEDQAVSHLFTVAAGLDSMVVGETQVLGQLRAAYALAREQGTVGRALHPVAQRALRVGKRVHTETGIDRAGASLVSSEVRAIAASWSSERPRPERASSYSSCTPTPNIKGSSAPSEHRTPAASRVGSGCASMDGTTPSSRFEVGHTSSVTSRSARNSSTAGSSAARIPCATRVAPSSSTAARTLSGPASSPA